jgi:prepilin-type N-terminal cleavage/methylation domain-containing protein
MNEHERAGFTLLELLTVIAIVVILAGLLLGGLNTAKSSARRTACLNQLRQINLGVRMYADDSQDTSPGVRTNSLNPWLAYKALMKSYVGSSGPSSPSERLFACPADKFHYSDYHSPRVAKSHHQQAKHDFSSYVFNAGNYHPRFPGIAGLPLSSITDPARTVLVTEAPALWPYSWHHPSRGSDYINASHFNNARDNVSFVDGHARYLRMYLDTAHVAVGHEEAWHYDPPPGYDYKWSPD